MLRTASARALVGPRRWNKPHSLLSSGDSPSQAVRGYGSLSTTCSCKNLEDNFNASVTRISLVIFNSCFRGDA